MVERRMAMFKMPQITPYHYQEIGSRFLRTRTAGLIGDEVGLGKTLQAVLALIGGVRGPVLIIASTVSQPFWRQTLLDFDPDTVCISLGVGGRFTDSLHRVFLTTCFKHPQDRIYVLVHHEALRTCYEQLKNFGVWHAIVADEAHRFKNRKAQQTRALKQIPTLRKWSLTATPFEKLPGDLWSLLNWFDPKHFTSYWKFTENFVEFEYQSRFELRGDRLVEVQVPNTARPKGPKNLEELKKLLSQYYLRRTKEEVSIELPPITVVDMPLDMTTQQSIQYQTVKQSYLLLIEDRVEVINGPLARMAKLQAIALHPPLSGLWSEGESVKIQWIKNWIEENTNEPVVIFSTRVGFAHKIKEELGDICGVVTGDSAVPERQEVVQRFQEGRLQVIVGTYAAMSESLNLQRASYVIAADVHRSSIMMTQAFGRVHRLGSQNPVIAYRLSCNGTVDELLLKAIDKKWSDLELIEAYLQYEKDLA